MQRRKYLKTMAAGTLSTGILLDACSTPADAPKTAAVAAGPLSARGVQASKTVVRVDLDLYFEAAANLYDPKINPQGKFPLNVAENKLVWGLLKDKIETITRENPVESWVANYTSSVGALSTRQVMAGFIEKFLAHAPIDPAHLCMGPGAAAVIEQTSWILGEAGDVAVIPAPCYSVYTQDIGNRPGIERYNLVTHREMSELKSGPLLTIDHLEKAQRDIESQGKRFRMLILTNPDNPTGGIYTKAQLEAYSDWCITRNIHLVVNEIYGLSLLDTTHPLLRQDFSESRPFFSFINIIQQKQSDYLHWWYSLSKDFGASGFRVGVAFSLNAAYRKAFDNLNATAMVSNYAQWIFEKALADHDFVKSYVEANQRALTENYALAVSWLRQLGIPYAPARGSLFVWLDLSEFMAENTPEAERVLWMDLYQQTGVLLTPGDGFGHEKRGQFRLVYSYVPKEQLEVAMGRVVEFVSQRRANAKT